MSFLVAEEEVVKKTYKKAILEQKLCQFVNSCVVKKMKSKDLIILESQSRAFLLASLYFTPMSNLSTSIRLLIYIHIWVGVSLHLAVSYYTQKA